MTSYQPSGTGNELHPLRGMLRRFTEEQKKMPNTPPSAKARRISSKKWLELQ